VAGLVHLVTGIIYHIHAAPVYPVGVLLSKAAANFVRSQRIEVWIKVEYCMNESVPLKVHVSGVLIFPTDTQRGSQGHSDTALFLKAPACILFHK
jgi:hypothetical protein